ncbi:MAG TPA: hypothetical protein DEP42_01915 [Ruminococcaceae bacterium]|nr:hypothetical protein [Oscillospiraceae bacterium]
MLFARSLLFALSFLSGRVVSFGVKRSIFPREIARMIRSCFPRKARGKKKNLLILGRIIFTQNSGFSACFSFKKGENV